MLKPQTKTFPSRTTVSVLPANKMMSTSQQMQCLWGLCLIKQTKGYVFQGEKKLRPQINNTNTAKETRITVLKRDAYPIADHTQTYTKQIRYARR